MKEPDYPKGYIVPVPRPEDTAPITTMLVALVLVGAAVLVAYLAWYYAIGAVRSVL